MKKICISAFLIFALGAAWPADAQFAPRTPHLDPGPLSVARPFTFVVPVDVGVPGAVRTVVGCDVFDARGSDIGGHRVMVGAVSRTTLRIAVIPDRTNGNARPIAWRCRIYPEDRQGNIVQTRAQSVLSRNGSLAEASAIAVGRLTAFGTSASGSVATTSRGPVAHATTNPNPNLLPPGAAVNEHLTPGSQVEGLRNRRHNPGGPSEGTVSFPDMSISFDDDPDAGNGANSEGNALAAEFHGGGHEAPAARPANMPNPLYLNLPANAISPRLIQMAISGRHERNATINAGGRALLVLRDVTIQSLEIRNSRGAGLPLIRLGLRFSSYRLLPAVQRSAGVRP